MTITVLPATQPVSSRDMCTLALGAYDAVRMAAARYDDPDLGLAISFHLGRNRLAARLDAAPWPLSPETTGAVTQLIGSAPRSSTCAELVDWLEAFPTAFLTLLDRRVRQTEPLNGGRRSWDRVTAR